MPNLSVDRNQGVCRQQWQAGHVCSRDRGVIYARAFQSGPTDSAFAVATGHREKIASLRVSGVRFWLRWGTNTPGGARLPELPPRLQVSSDRHIQHYQDVVLAPAQD
jgi:hypothetical protein